MKTTPPSQVLADQLALLHCMETQIAREFPLLAGSVMNGQLRRLLSSRAMRARDRRDVLEGLLAGVEQPSGARGLNSVRSILAEGNRELARVRNPFARDVAMIEHCLRIEQHATTAYGIAVPLTHRMGFPEMAGRLGSLLGDLEMARPFYQAVETEVFSIAAVSPFGSFSGGKGSGADHSRNGSPRVMAAAGSGREVEAEGVETLVA